MGKLISRVVGIARLQDRTWQILQCWKSGMELCVDGSRVLIVFREKTCELELSLETGSTQSLITPAGTLASTGELFLVLLDSIETLLIDWLRVPTTVHIPCPHCISSGRVFPRRFTWEECEIAAMKGCEYLFCPGDVQPIKLTEIAPDLTISGNHISPSLIHLRSGILGKGSMACVHQCTIESETGLEERTYAVKKFVPIGTPSTLSPNSFSRETVSCYNPNEVLHAFRKETRLMNSLHHENIVSTEGWTRFTDGSFAIVMEYMNIGSLYSFLRDFREGKKNDLGIDVRSWEFRIKISLDVAKGMSYLHQSNPPIIHRDLKSPNVLVSLSTSPSSPYSSTSYFHSFSYSYSYSSSSSCLRLHPSLFLSVIILGWSGYSEDRRFRYFEESSFSTSTNSTFC
jgi:hypothetical protein